MKAPLRRRVPRWLTHLPPIFVVAIVGFFAGTMIPTAASSCNTAGCERMCDTGRIWGDFGIGVAVFDINVYLEFGCVENPEGGPDPNSMKAVSFDRREKGKDPECPKDSHIIYSAHDGKLLSSDNSATVYTKCITPSP